MICFFFLNKYSALNNFIEKFQTHFGIPHFIYLFIFLLITTNCADTDSYPCRVLLKYERLVETKQKNDEYGKIELIN